VSKMFAHRHQLSLRLWQRLAQAQVGRRTFLTCHVCQPLPCLDACDQTDSPIKTVANPETLRTAEDLTATSRRLARYEALLNEIMPHVPPNVKAMIEEAREQVTDISLTCDMEDLTRC
jgi:hypothetical protein